MRILLSNASDEPIYSQIRQQIKRSILTGELSEGAPLPSIRQLAKDLQISVITTKRAYEELEKEGLVETVPGKGSYVSGQNQAFLREQRLRRMEELLMEAVREAKLLGLTAEQLMDNLKLCYEEEDGE